MGAKLVVLGLLASGVLSGSAGADSAGWRDPIGVPGLQSLNTGGYANVSSVSCGARNVCVAVGGYHDRTGPSMPFVASETGGRWEGAIEVPGMEALGAGQAGLSSVSCRAAGACSAGGSYTDTDSRTHAFVVDESHGSWGDAIEVPGTSALGVGYEAVLRSISCGAPGECVAGGHYLSVHRRLPWVAIEKHGVWGDAIRVRGTLKLARGATADVTSVSCGAAGDCVVGGYYEERSANQQAFVADLRNGRWGWAVEVPGLAALNRNENGVAAAEVSSVSCAAAGECAAGGDYTGSSGYFRAFVATETNGRWRNAVEVPDTVVTPDGSARVTSLSCAAAGRCTAGGYLTDLSHDKQAFLVSSSNGRWGHPIAVLGADDAEVLSVSCGAAGSCAAGGSYPRPGVGYLQGFLVSETHGHWGYAVEVPPMSVSDAEIDAISCRGDGMCLAGGYYGDPNGEQQAFVVRRPRRPR